MRKHYDTFRMTGRRCLTEQLHMLFGEEKNTDRTNTYWIFDHGTKHAQ